MKKRVLSVVLPAFNEEVNLGSSFREIRSFLLDHHFEPEFIIVDDASTDRTPEIAKALQDEFPSVNVIRHEVNQGPCSGLRTGPVTATNEWVLLLPIDQAIPLVDIETLWDNRLDADIVLGYIARGTQRAWPRRLQSRIYTKLVNLLFGMNLRQVNYVALYKASVFRAINLTTSGTALHAEVLVRAKQAGFSIGQTPLGFQPRVLGEASGSKPAVILKTFSELVQLRQQLSRGVPKT